MPSNHPDYEYDIFISYRHNDNKSGWVTEFVNNLETELSSTLKEPLSIYFDKNPHDGLLETHNVDQSLEGKLKCLVFIPIISQTYCDKKSFAWNNEFVAFNNLSKNDSLGREINLLKGNVASRILPVKIHKIDDEDISVLENEMGGFLRGIEFIYGEEGVNRPLNPNDDRRLNLEKTDYKNQINKIANSIKSLVLAIKHSENSIKSPAQKNQTLPPTSPSKSKRSLYAVISIIILSVTLTALFWGKFSADTPSEQVITQEEKSIAVLPFENMSNDPEQEYFGDGISEELINALAKMTNLKVAGRTSSFSFKNKKEDLRKVGESLGVNNILEGSVRKSGNTVRITAQLINVKDGFHIWTQTFDRELSDIFEVQDEITAAIIKELKVHLDEEPHTTKMLDVEAYSIYLKARQKVAQRGLENIIEARDLFYQALKLDSTYSSTYSGLSKTLSLLNNYSTGDRKFKDSYKEALIYAEKALQIDPNNAEAYMTLGIAKSWYEWDWESAKENINKSLALNPNDAEVNNFAGDFYRIIGDFEQSLKYETIALENDPMHAVNHWDLGTTNLLLGNTEKAKAFIRSCLRLNKELVYIIYPALTYELRSDPFINELELIYNSIDKNKYSEALNLHITTAFAIGKNETDKALALISELEQFAEQGSVSSAYILDYYYILGNKEKMKYWAAKAVENKDPLLVYESFRQVPEMYEDEGVAEILSSPELDILYDIRRKNLGLTK